MAKFKRKQKRKLKFESIALLLLFFALMSELLCAVFIKTRNTNLTMQIQDLNSEIAAMKAENSSLSIEIQTLENKERVYVIAQNAGLDQNQDNIVSINNKGN